LDRMAERGAARALHRLLEAIGTPAAPSVGSPIAALTGGGFLRRILATAGRRGVVIPVDEILWIGADDYCATIVTASGRSVVRESLVELERRLDPEHFVRVHRSAIVRIGAVRGVRRDERSGRLELVDGSMIPVARSRLRAVIVALGGAL